MSRQTYRYFMIPLASVPAKHTYKLWFSTWSANRAAYIWSENRPDPAPSSITWVVGATDEDDFPPDATVIIANSVKCIPPPILAAPVAITDASKFQTALIRSMEGIRSLPDL